MKIAVNEPVFGGREKELLAECIDTGWISSEGPFVGRFEKEFAARVGRRHGVAVCNGSAALELAMVALGIGPGDEVILPSFTIISCAAAVVRAGATPVVVDCDVDTWNMDVALIEEKITAATRAIMAVHIYGLPTEMQGVMAIARRHGLRVMEDAAEAHGLTCGGRPCGSFGDVSTFSFYPNKLVTTGEGGMVLVDDDALATRLRSHRNLCFGEERRFVHESLGWNFRMSNLQAAVGVAQLEQSDRFLERKRRTGARYAERLQVVPGLRLPLPRTSYAENGYWVFGVVLDDDVSFDAREMMRRLAERGVATRPFFWPMHEQPVLKRMGLFDGESCPVSERIARRGFYLPSGVGMTDAQVDAVCDELEALMRGEGGAS